MGTVQINTGLAVKKNSAGIGTSAQGFRRALGAFFGQTSPGAPAPGRLGADNLMVTGTSRMAYSISPGYGVITRPSQGVYIVPLHIPTAVDTDPTGGVNPRIDRIYVRQPDPEIDGPDVDPRGVLGVVCGVPSSNPALPGLPPGSLELARTVVPASATRTDSLSFTNLAPVTSIQFGGTLPVARGGTGAGTKTLARTNLGFLSGSGAPANTLGDDGDWYVEV